MLMVCGAAISKTKAYPGFIKYQQPSLWRRLGQTRSKRDLRDSIASKIGEHSFESMRYSRSRLMEIYSRMIKDESAAIEVTADLGLELEELMYLSGSTKPSKKLQKIYDEAQDLYREGSEETEGIEFFKTPAPSGNENQMLPGCTVKYPEKKDGGSPGKSEPSNSQVSENKQKTPNSGFDFSPEPSGEKINLESSKPDIFKSDKFIPDNFASDGFILDSPIPDNFISNSSEPDGKLIDNEISTRSSKRKALTKNDLVVEKVSELKPANLEAEAEKTSKKTESKSQKSLFDF
jgi:replication factor C large subunit